MRWEVFTTYGRSKLRLGLFQFRGDAMVAVRALQKSKSKHRRGHRYYGYRKRF